MPLHSQVFLFIFLPTFLSVFFISHIILKRKIVDDFLLILGSLIFYSWGGINSYIYLIVISFILWCYSLISIRKIQNKKILYLIVIIICIPLIYFKYFNFFFSYFEDLSYFSPLAISFISFSAISVAVEINREPEKIAFHHILLYLCLFPKMLAGPIILWKEFKSSYQNRKITIEKVSKGIERFIIGYAKKTIIANTLELAVTGVYTNFYIGVDNLSLWLLILSYGMQLYFDFSGYSDMAIGLLSIFGFDIKENFNFPYQSKSISEFWRRWHISLGNWFREYIYIPLGGNKKGNVYLNILIVFVLTGFWHGAAWKYMLWGLAHGIAIMFEKNFLKQINNTIFTKIYHLFCVVFIFFAWIPFSAPSLSLTLNFLKQLITFNSPEVFFKWSYYFNNRTLTLLFIALIYSFFYKKEKNNFKIPDILKYSLLLILFIVAVSFSVNGNYSPFLYARY